MRQPFLPASEPHAAYAGPFEMIGDVSKYWATA